MTDQIFPSAGGYELGATVTFTKTIGESDVYLFAGITGDLSPNHVNEAYMAQTRYGKRIAHGALLIGYASTCSTRLIERGGDIPTVSYGYERIRFIGPAFIGDTVTVTYTVAERDLEQGRYLSDVTITNQDGETIAVAQHILKVVVAPDDESAR
jgi:3-hydroxybutyryl-CoA dehydratase